MIGGPEGASGILELSASVALENPSHRRTRRLTTNCSFSGRGGLDHHAQHLERQAEGAKGRTVKFSGSAEQKNWHPVESYPPPAQRAIRRF